MEESALLTRTGCLGPCNLPWFDTRPFMVETVPKSSEEDRVLELTFSIMSGVHTQLTEYLIYDSDTMFADVGGYLGLLLGHCVLSVYDNIVKWAMKAI